MPCFVVPMTFNLQNYSASNPEPRMHATGETIELRVLNKENVYNNNTNPKGTGFGDDILWSSSLQKGIWYELFMHK